MINTNYNSLSDNLQVKNNKRGIFSVVNKSSEYAFHVQNEVLEDGQYDWKDKKTKSLKVAHSFGRLGMDNRSMRLFSCGRSLLFHKCSEDGYVKLVKADFCRDRLCPMCNGRRSRMLFGQICKVINSSLVDNPSMRFLFWTLTVKRCSADELMSVVNNVFKAFNRLFKYKSVDKHVLGFIRSFEVTYDSNEYITKDMWYGNALKHMKARKNHFSKMGLKIGDPNPYYDTYLPHFHVLIGVAPSYFDGNNYHLSIDDLSMLWKRALQVDYSPIVKIQAVKSVGDSNIENFSDNSKYDVNFSHAIAETAKYSVKEADYVLNDPDKMDRVISVLSSVLRSRRLVGFGKLFKEKKYELCLQDIESDDADLVCADGSDNLCPICGRSLSNVVYVWDKSRNNYVVFDGYFVKNE